MPPETKRLRVLAGPNGSGKTTISRSILNNFYCGPFVNADYIEALLGKTGFLNPYTEYGIQLQNEDFTSYLKKFGKTWAGTAEKSKGELSISFENGLLLVRETPTPYDSAFAADFIRFLMLEQNQTFTFETVLSHPSKVNFMKMAKEKGYKNYLYFISTINPEINSSRVKNRKVLGGHDVPVNKIVERYYRSLELIKEVIPFCRRAYFFDNSSSEFETFGTPVAEIHPDGRLTLTKDEIPWWLQEYVINPLYL